MTSLREFDLRPSIRDAAAEIGYHDELSTGLEYSTGTYTARWHTRSTDHAIEGELFGPYVDEEDRKETVERAADILQGWNDGVYRENDVDFDAWTREPIETSEETRFVDLNVPEDAEVTATRLEQCEGMKDMDAASYCTHILGTYIDSRIDNGLWQEKPSEVMDILERNGDTFLADLVETYTRQPALTIGHTIYTEHVDPEKAATPEEYLEGLEKDRFQPI